MVARNRRVGFAFLIFGLTVMIYAEWELGRGSLNNPGAGFFPLLCGLCIAAFSGIWILSLCGAQSDINSPFWGKGELLGPMLAVLITLGYATILEGIGFLLSTLIFIVVWQLLIEREKWPKTMAVSLIGTASMYLLFKVLLSVPLPRSAIGFLNF